VLLAHAAEGAADEWRESLARLGEAKQAASDAVPQLLGGFLDLCGHLPLLGGFLDLCGHLPLLGAFLDLRGHLPVGSKSEQQLLEYISAVTSRVKALQVGKSLIIPAGWCNPSDAGDFALLFVVERTSLEHFMFAVVNTGPEGLGYHPIRANVSETANMTYRLALVFEEVAETKLTDSSFWFMTGRMQ
ncbi:hypothetical protein T484DRAFT_1851540, partial [Baffinella frigidus]